ncbi:MAG TPA: hypothetical protein VL225_21115 [Vicinamibacterales bacterium]|jgi:hypothetical protein|nr:hypothetical protein [Vicinamibacterales bacterium]
MEVSEVRRRLRAAIEEARRRAGERRTRADEASRAWERRLPDVVVPAFQAVQSALGGEGYRFTVSTPGESARLSPERSAQDFVEIALDAARDEPAVVIRSTRGRGRHTVSAERIVRESGAIDGLTQDEVVAALLDELIPFIER